MVVFNALTCWKLSIEPKNLHKTFNYKIGVGCFENSRFRRLGPVTGNPIHPGKVEDGPWFLSVWINNWRLLAWRDLSNEKILVGWVIEGIILPKYSTIECHVMDFAHYVIPKICGWPWFWVWETWAEALMVPNALGYSEFNWRSFHKNESSIDCTDRPLCTHKWSFNPNLQDFISPALL